MLTVRGSPSPPPSSTCTHWCFTSCPGTVTSQLPPASAARSTTTLPSRIDSTMARVMSLGAGLPGISAVVTMMSTSAAAAGGGGGGRRDWKMGVAAAGRVSERARGLTR
jgi:hypothetical protein